MRSCQTSSSRPLAFGRKFSAPTEPPETSLQPERSNEAGWEEARTDYVLSGCRVMNRSHIRWSSSLSIKSCSWSFLLLATI